MNNTLLQFSARVITGAGRGKKLGTPTINLQMEDVPKELTDGIYAVRSSLEEDNHWLPAVMHYGPRPVYGDSPSCEVHFLDRHLQETPKALRIEVIAFIRAIEDFPSEEALQKKIQEDIEHAKEVLQSRS